MRSAHCARRRPDSVSGRARRPGSRTANTVLRAIRPGAFIPGLTSSNGASTGDRGRRWSQCPWECPPTWSQCGRSVAARHEQRPCYRAAELRVWYAPQGFEPPTARSVVMHHPSLPVLLDPSRPRFSSSAALSPVRIGQLSPPVTRGMVAMWSQFRGIAARHGVWRPGLPDRGAVGRSTRFRIWCSMSGRTSASCPPR